MARPAKTERTITKHLALPVDVVARMELELYSEAEERVPVGAQAELITQLLRQHFHKQDRIRRREAKAVADAPLPEGG